VGGFTKLISASMFFTTILPYARLMRRIVEKRKRGAINICA